MLELRVQHRLRLMRQAGVGSEGDGNTLILCYHAVTTSDWSAAVAVSAKRFALQMRLLAQRGYRGVTFAEAARDAGSGKRVAVTFDDAFHSVLDEALPVLERYGWPASVFVVTDYGEGDRLLAWPALDRWLGTQYEPELRAMNWDELGELQARGWEIGSHTASHPHLTALDGDQLRRELEQSRRVCVERFGSCDSIAYPYGDVNPEVVAAAREAGYSAGAALPTPLHSVRPLEWPRIGVYSGDHMMRFVAKVTPLRRRLRAGSG